MMLQRIGAAGQLPERRTHIFGVDFSGAVDAGRKIWISQAEVKEHSLLIQECLPAEALPGSGRERAAALGALRRLIESNADAVFGLDFPFSLPASLVRSLFGTSDWAEFVTAFPERFPDPESFRSACLDAAGGRETRRETDRRASTPFSAYNLRLFLQSYYGIADILAPLVRSDLARILPMQSAKSGRPWLLEICPASTLKRIEIYAPYKGRTMLHTSARRVMMTSLAKKGPLSFADDAEWDRVLSDAGGDALDSVVAAFAAFKNLQDPSFDVQNPSTAEFEMCEGYVYA